MAPRETENNDYAKFWGGKERALWYVEVFSGVVNRPFARWCQFIPWVPETFYERFPVSSYSHRREKPLEKTAIGLIAPSQSQARLNRLGPDSRHDG